MWRAPTECIIAVRQIEQYNGDGGHLISKVGPYDITDGSVKVMQSPLSDETIDAYLHVLTVERTNVYHVYCLTMTSYLRMEINMAGSSNMLIYFTPDFDWRCK